MIKEIKYNRLTFDFINFLNKCEVIDDEQPHWCTIYYNNSEIIRYIYGHNHILIKYKTILQLSRSALTLDEIIKIITEKYNMHNSLVIVDGMYHNKS